MSESIDPEMDHDYNSVARVSNQEHNNPDDEEDSNTSPQPAFIVIDESNSDSSESYESASGQPTDAQQQEQQPAPLPPAECEKEQKEMSLPPPENKPSLNKSQEDEGETCTICFETWTSSGEHRLISLRCGHLFGRSCILKWLKGQGARCPQCNARARKSEVRPIYARSLKVLDTSERDRALEQLEREVLLRKRAELDYTQMKLKYQMSILENQKLRKELVAAQKLLHEACTSQNSGKTSQAASHSLKHNVSIEVSPHGGCRLMDVSDLLGMMVVTQPSTNPLFPGFGLKKISLPHMKTNEFVCLHQKEIKDVAFHRHDGLVLTASFDKTVKITNFITNSTVQTYHLPVEVWSCSWDMDDSRYFYSGLRNGKVCVFDIRMTNTYVTELSIPGHTTPAVSLQFLSTKRTPISTHGPIVGHLNNSCFYSKMGDLRYQPNPLPLEGSFTSLSCDSETGHLLLSCRPSSRHNQVTHTLCSLSFDDAVFSCNLVQTMFGGQTQVKLARAKLFAHPENVTSVLVFAGDEEAQAALVWDGGTGVLIDSLKAESPVSDVVTFRDQDVCMFATLTEKTLRVYKWNG